MVDVINVKCELDMVGLPIQTYGFLTEYHLRYTCLLKNDDI